MVYLVTLAITQTTNVSGKAIHQKRNWKRICKEASVSYFEVLPGMYEDGRGESTKNLSVIMFSFHLRSNPNQLVHHVLSVLSLGAGKKVSSDQKLLPLCFLGHSLAAQLSTFK